MSEAVTITLYPNVPVTRPRAVGEVVSVSFGRELLSVLVDPDEGLAVHDPAAAKGAAGYVVAAPVPGPRSNAAAEPTRCLALDYDDAPAGPNWAALDRLRYVAYTTDSHREDAPRWRVWVLLAREYSAEEVARASVPAELAGAHLRAISQPVYLPTKADDVVWQLGPETAPALALEDWWGPAGPVPGPAAAPTPWAPPPGGVTHPSAASTNALVTRWLTRPEGTNRLAGALGAALAEWGWDDDAVRGYVEAWFSAADPKWRKHADDAVRGARKRRAGDRIVGFPTLAEELGQPFAAEPAAGAGVLDEEFWAAVAAEPPAAAPAPEPAPAGAEAGGEWTTAADVAAWDPPPVPWLVEALGVAPGAPTLVSGYGGSGKTTFVQHLALTVATPGERLLGEFPVRHGSVTHLDYEQGFALTARRYRRLGLRADAALRFRSAPPHYLGDPADSAARKWFALACVGQALVVVDSLVAGLGPSLEDENATQAREPLDFFGRVSEATGAVVLVIHHSKKDRSNARTSARGSSAITDAVSCHLTYEKNDDEGPRGAPTLSIQKLRQEAPPALVWEPFRVSVAPRGVPADGGYSLVVGDSAEALAEARAAALETQIITALAAGPVRSVSELAKQLSQRKTETEQALNSLDTQGLIDRTGKNIALARAKASSGDGTVDGTARK